MLLARATSVRARLKMMSCPRIDYFIASWSWTRMLTVSWSRRFSMLKRLRRTVHAGGSVPRLLRFPAGRVWPAYCQSFPAPPVIRMRFPFTKDAKSVMPLFCWMPTAFLITNLSLLHFIVDTGKVFANNPDRNQMNPRQHQNRTATKPSSTLLEPARQSAHNQAWHIQKAGPDEESGKGDKLFSGFRERENRVECQGDILSGVYPDSLANRSPRSTASWNCTKRASRAGTAGLRHGIHRLHHQLPHGGNFSVVGDMDVQTAGQPVK